ncbi:ftsK/SpoIIIE family protein [Neorickettsia helminthoeca str. Oregon]|uniref:FtsK/SpoIIIE family protein n=1 Tax=Neorickettsia helminthoeca str. Oregon TaxID=1286528 RepID=X5H4S0_9RICK|nr:ftsK/SpoIIIE family protein [Neorickettsia helminthoeca str. Oregon]
MITKRVHNKLQNITHILFGITYRLGLLFLIVCGLISNPEEASFNVAVEKSRNEMLFLGSFVATFCMNFLGLGFYLLCLFLIFSAAFSKEKKVLSILFILLSIVVLAKLTPSEEWLFGSYGGVIGSLIAKHLKYPRAVYWCIAGMLLIVTRIFNLLTLRRIRKILKKIYRLLKTVIVAIWSKRKFDFRRKGTEPITPNSAVLSVDRFKEELPVVSTYTFLRRATDQEESSTGQPGSRVQACDESTAEKCPTEDCNLDDTDLSIHSDYSGSEEVKITTTHNTSREKKSIFQKAREAAKLGGSGKVRSTIPSLDLLKRGNPSQKCAEDTLGRAENLKKVLEDFKIDCKIVEISVGPIVTLYELQPAAGIKSSSIISLSTDVARTMSAVSARISIIPGRNAIGIELPNKHREVVLLRELLESEVYKDQNIVLPIALGKNISGEPIVADLTKMPHLLVAGTTGSGKSVAINAMILSLIYRLEPHECKLIMVDPKMLELSIYDDIPHLLSPVVTDPKKAVVALKWVVKEMERRYKLMTKLAVRNIERYNKKAEEFIKNNKLFEYEEAVGIDPTTGEKLTQMKSIQLKKLPLIVVVVDEMADLMLVAGKEIETSIQRLAQMARASGIHIIMATQRPSVDVITGVIKANFPTRISFAVTSKIDSRTILGEQGAEQLLGRGDMLYMSSGQTPIRVHGPYVSDTEVEKIVEHLRKSGIPEYDCSITLEENSDESTAICTSVGDDFDSLYNQAVEIIKRDNKVSISYIQRKLSIGYNKAAKLVEKMEEEGIVSPPNQAGKRNILL